MTKIFFIESGIYQLARKFSAQSLLLFIVFAASLPLCRGESTFAGMILGPRASLKGINIPICETSGGRPVLTMQVGKISLETARMGFMKINLFQQVVLENCRLTILLQGNWCRALVVFLRENKLMNNALIKGFEITAQSEDGHFSLHASTGALLPDEGRIDLRGVSWSRGREIRHFDSASICLDGPDSEFLLFGGGRLKLP